MFFRELWILHIQIELVVMLIAADLYLQFHISQRHSSGSLLPFPGQTALCLTTNQTIPSQAAVPGYSFSEVIFGAS